MKFIVCFLKKWDLRFFCINEFESLCAIFNAQYKYLDDMTEFDPHKSPYLHVDIVNEKVSVFRNISNTIFNRTQIQSRHAMNVSKTSLIEVL